MNAVTRRTLVAAAPAGLAIAVFGTIYGALFRPLAGTAMTLLTSALIFSGALQFTLASLLAAGAGPVAIVVAGLTLNVRHLLLGAVLRPRLSGGTLERTVSSFLLTDEAVGFALAEEEDPIVHCGLRALFATRHGSSEPCSVYSAHRRRENVAAAVFPVLFIGLSAVAASSRDHALRALGAALITVGITLVWPGARFVAPAVAAVVVSLPGESG